MPHLRLEGGERLKPTVVIVCDLQYLVPLVSAIRARVGEDAVDFSWFSSPESLQGVVRAVGSTRFTSLGWIAIAALCHTFPREAREHEGIPLLTFHSDYLKPSDQVCTMGDCMGLPVSQLRSLLAEFRP